MKTGNQVREEIIEVLNNGKDRITEEEMTTAISTLDAFLASHPGYIFLSVKERRLGGPNEQKIKEKIKTIKEKQESARVDEIKMWEIVQPILDKAQGVDTDGRERLRKARSENPLYRKDFTLEELEWMKRDLVKFCVIDVV